MVECRVTLGWLARTNSLQVERVTSRPDARQAIPVVQYMRKNSPSPKKKKKRAQPTTPITSKEKRRLHRRRWHYVPFPVSVLIHLPPFDHALRLVSTRLILFVFHNMFHRRILLVRGTQTHPPTLPRWSLSRIPNIGAPTDQP